MKVILFPEYFLSGVDPHRTDHISATREQTNLSFAVHPTDLQNECIRLMLCTLYKFLMEITASKQFLFTHFRQILRLKPHLRRGPYEITGMPVKIAKMPLTSKTGQLNL